jgi:hypothetical protein
MLASRGCRRWSRRKAQFSIAGRPTSRNGLPLLFECHSARFSSLMAHRNCSAGLAVTAGMERCSSCTDPRCRRFRLSHAGSIRAALSLPPELSHPCSSWLFPPKTQKQVLAADSFANFSLPGPQFAVYAISCYPTLDRLRDSSTADK